VNLEQSIEKYLSDLRNLAEEIDSTIVVAVAKTFHDICEAGGTVFVCGNGGSASTASHMACDLSKNVTDSKHHRLKVVSLTDNMAHFSALANDLDYDQVFVEQLHNLMTPKDALIAISTSGNSANVINAARFARDQGVPVIAMTGFSGGALRDLGTASLHVDCPEYGPVEDMHLVFNHLLVVALRAMMNGDE